MQIRDGDILIRNAVTVDAPTLCQWWNDGAVMAHAGFPNGLGTTEEKICAELAAEGEGTRRRLMIMLGGEPIGEMSYQSEGDAVASIGIKICRPEFQEKGYGSRILQLFLHKLFQIGYEKVILDTNLDNTRAQHVYEKLGFRKTAVKLDSWRDQLGQLQSVVEYELEKQDMK